MAWLRRSSAVAFRVSGTPSDAMRRLASGTPHPGAVLYDFSGRVAGTVHGLDFDLRCCRGRPPLGPRLVGRAEAAGLDTILRGEFVASLAPTLLAVVLSIRPLFLAAERVLAGEISAGFRALVPCGWIWLAASLASRALWTDCEHIRQHVSALFPECREVAGARA
jgi:hypothetical protein